MYKPTKSPPAIRRTTLALRRETIVHLTTVQLRAIAGGLIETLTCWTSPEVCGGVSQVGPCDPRSVVCTGA